jgi:plasmid stabilization system protein ParE
VKLRFLSRARRDLVWFQTYYDSVFREGADRARRQYRRTMANILSNPYIGHPVESGVRRFPIPRTPFSAIYRVAEDEIEILRVLDQRAEEQAEP